MRVNSIVNINRITIDNNNNEKFFTITPWRPQLGILLVTFLSVSIVAIVMISFSYELIYWFVHCKKVKCKQRRPEKIKSEKHTQYILCTEENAKFEYKLIFRVGRATKDFDLQRAHINFEVLEGRGDWNLTTTSRFLCSNLKNAICANMNLLISMVRPIKSINGIRANHNDLKGFIFLYDYVLIDLNTENVMEICQINQYITNRSTIYRGKMFRKKEIENNPDLLIPLIPVIWTRIELIIVGSLVAISDALFVMLCEYFNLYLFNYDQDGSLYRSFQDIFLASIFGTFLSFYLVLIYKHYLKWRLIQTQYSPIDTIYDYEFWKNGCILFLIVCIVIIWVIAIGLIYFGLNISLVKSEYWLISWLTITICVFSIWAISEQLSCFFNSNKNNSTNVDQIMEIELAKKQTPKKRKSRYNNQQYLNNKILVFPMMENEEEDQNELILVMKKRKKNDYEIQFGSSNDNNNNNNNNFVIMTNVNIINKKTLINTNNNDNNMLGLFSQSQSRMYNHFEPKMYNPKIGNNYRINTDGINNKKKITTRINNKTNVNSKVRTKTTMTTTKKRKKNKRKERI